MLQSDIVAEVRSILTPDIQICDSTAILSGQSLICALVQQFATMQTSWGL
jgi:hypothetical protein